jgi:hypothetical protein
MNLTNQLQLQSMSKTDHVIISCFLHNNNNRAFDMTLVEKIECSSDGEILFACTSIDTPKVPKTPGKNRHQIKVN